MTPPPHAERRAADAGSRPPLSPPWPASSASPACASPAGSGSRARMLLRRTSSRCSAASRRRRAPRRARRDREGERAEHDPHRRRARRARARRPAPPTPPTVARSSCRSPPRRPRCSRRSAASATPGCRCASGTSRPEEQESCAQASAHPHPGGQRVSPTFSSLHVRNYRIYATGALHLQHRHLDGPGRAGLAGPHRADRPLLVGARHRHRPAVPAVPAARAVGRHDRRPVPQAAASSR